VETMRFWTSGGPWLEASAVALNGLSLDKLQNDIQPLASAPGG